MRHPPLGCQNACAHEGLLGSEVTRVKSIVPPRAGRPLLFATGKGEPLENDTYKIIGITSASGVKSR